MIMKQYVIDELRPGDCQRIKESLDEKFGPSRVEGIYWIPVDPEYLTEEQAEHINCRPHYFAVVLDKNYLACELLIRTTNRVRCSCMGYANKNQRNWIINFADTLFDTLNIKI